MNLALLGFIFQLNIKFVTVYETVTHDPLSYCNMKKEKSSHTKILCHKCQRLIN